MITELVVWGLKTLCILECFFTSFKIVFSATQRYHRSIKVFFSWSAQHHSTQHPLGLLQKESHWQQSLLHSGFPHKLFLMLLLLVSAGLCYFPSQQMQSVCSVWARLSTWKSLAYMYVRMYAEVNGSVKACGGGGCQVERVSGGGALRAAAR